jgi:hypothetical protein
VCDNVHLACFQPRSLLPMDKSCFAAVRPDPLEFHLTFLYCVALKSVFRYSSVSRVCLVFLKVGQPKWSGDIVATVWTQVAVTTQCFNNINWGHFWRTLEQCEPKLLLHRTVAAVPSYNFLAFDNIAGLVLLVTSSLMMWREGKLWNCGVLLRVRMLSLVQ